MIHPFHHYRPALAAQLLHIGFCILWNACGLWQTARGLPPIGPTSSYAAIGLVVMLAIGLVTLLRKSRELPYLALSAVGLLLAGVAIRGAFTKDPSSWPSEFWRWAGVAVNAVGVIGFVLALAIYFRRNFTKTATSHEP